MMKWEQTMEIKILHRQGKSLRCIANEVGISVNTVRKYLKQDGNPFYKKRLPVTTKLDSYKDYLKERINASRPLCLPATVFLQEIRDHGYTGGLTQLRIYLHSLKPVVVEEPVRFETDPGYQMQVD